MLERPLLNKSEGEHDDQFRDTVSVDDAALRPNKRRKVMVDSSNDMMVPITRHPVLGTQNYGFDPPVGPTVRKDKVSSHFVQAQRSHLYMNNAHRRLAAPRGLYLGPTDRAQSTDPLPGGLSPPPSQWACLEESMRNRPLTKPQQQMILQQQQYQKQQRMMAQHAAAQQQLALQRRQQPVQQHLDTLRDERTKSKQIMPRDSSSGRPILTQKAPTIFGNMLTPATSAGPQKDIMEKHAPASEELLEKELPQKHLIYSYIIDEFSAGGVQSEDSVRPFMNDRIVNKSGQFCELCRESFSIFDDFFRHRRDVHGIFEPGDDIWRCHIKDCDMGFKIWSRRDGFRTHLQRTHWNHFDRDVNKVHEFMDQCKEYYDPKAHVSSALGYQTQPMLEDTILHAAKNTIKRWCSVADEVHQQRGKSGQYTGGTIHKSSASSKIASTNQANRSHNQEVPILKPNNGNISGMKIRFDTLSQDRSSGERRLLLCALSRRVVSVDIVRRLQSGGLK